MERKKSLVCHHLFGFDINKNYFYYKELFYYNYTYFFWKLWSNTFSEIVVLLFEKKIENLENISNKTSNQKLSEEKSWLQLLQTTNLPWVGM